MRWLFWTSVLLIGYAYLGYAAWLWVLSRYRFRPVRQEPHVDSISIVMVVHNEAAVLRRKLTNLLEMNYPPDKTEIIVVSDGSTDASYQILDEFGSVPRLRVILKSSCCGKAAGLNDAIQVATGEIVVFTDARQKIEDNAVRFLVENFADPEVGCVSGELMLGESDSGETAGGIGLYWRVEKKIREMESATGSVIGATGALYAVRRKLLMEVPPETILDDVYIPLNLVRLGSRVVFDARARIWDVADQGTRREFARKVRTLSGNYQLLRIAPWLLSSANPVRFGFVSHKLMRLVVPFALVALLISAAALSGTFYRAALALQIVFYALGAWALIGPRRGLLGKAADVAFALIMLNTAAVVALANFLTGRRAVWAR